LGASQTAFKRRVYFKEKCEKSRDKKLIVVLNFDPLSIDLDIERGRFLHFSSSIRSQKVMVQTLEKAFLRN